MFPLAQTGDKHSNEELMREFLRLRIPLLSRAVVGSSCRYLGVTVGPSSKGVSLIGPLRKWETRTVELTAAARAPI